MGAPLMAMTATERSRVLRERRAHDPRELRAHNAMKRRCAEPRRQHPFRRFTPWRGSSTGRECGGSGANQIARTAARILIA
jgi:hypothetical protein